MPRSKFTEERRRIIVEALEKGHYLTVAAALAKVDTDTIYLWLKRGRAASSGRYYEFARAVEEAMAVAEDVSVAIIDGAAGDDWRAAAWKMERRHPDRWGKKERHEVTGKDGGEIVIRLEWPSGATPPSEL